jgi:uroporphyrinogen-III synthase
LVPLFSPRTALAFAEQDNGQAPRHLIALSEDVAVPVRKLNWSSLTVCAAPTRGTMIDAVQKVVTSITLG